jgi:hypothetical protein
VLRTLTLTVEQDRRGKSIVRSAHLQGCGIEHRTGGAGIFIEIADHGDLPNPSLLDGFVLLLLFHAMEHADILRVRGAVSARALRNYHIFQEAWRCYCPHKYHIVAIEPDSVVETMPPGARGAVSAFSGGVDSAFLAMRHGGRSLGPSSYPLDSVAIVHGFDIDCEDQASFVGLVRRTAQILEQCGLRPITVRTNVRKFALQDWEHCHAANIAAVLHQFSHRYNYGMIASTDPYNHQAIPWGSSPATDYLLGGNAMEIVHEGAGYSRTEKVEFIAKHAAIARCLKVCWEGPKPDRNCGSCEKCVRTRLNFMAVGMPEPGCFDTRFDIPMVDSLTPRNEGQFIELASILAYAESRSLHREWLSRLRGRLLALQEKLGLQHIQVPTT